MCFYLHFIFIKISSWLLLLLEWFWSLVKLHAFQCRQNCLTNGNFKRGGQWEEQSITWGKNKKNWATQRGCSLWETLISPHKILSSSLNLGNKTKQSYCYANTSRTMMTGVVYFSHRCNCWKVNDIKWG